MALRINAQLLIARDTITVLENGYVLKMPWANGLNYANASQVDLDFDGKKDIVIFDRSGSFSGGRFRCFINKGTPGDLIYRAAPELSYKFPQAWNWAILKDYNCDGKEDLFCSTTLGIQVWRNTSTPAAGISFTLAKSLLYSDYNPGGNPYISNLYASPSGVPGISDIDGDGDLDILTFASQGIQVEYHKNKTFEKYGKCDSLVFELGEYCWGNISENGCLVDLNACPSAQASVILPGGLSKPYHAGSCLTCLDSDADGDKDLIMGDVFCNVVQYAHNNGTTTHALFDDTTKLYPNYPNKNTTTQIKINNFPCAYTIDADNNGKTDLIASPNAPNGENFKSVWYYKNTSTSNTVNFQFVKNNFLQDEMIEVGQNSFPVLFDYNADGKKDLLIGNYGYYTNNSLSGRLTLYENTGTGTAPVFSLVSRDYGGLSGKNLTTVMPAVGDIDADGDVDICIGVSTGQVHWLENTGGSGQACNFSVFKTNPFSFTTTSGSAAPQLFDIDSDGKPDLLIGTRNGKISLYKNVSSGGTTSFSLVTANLGSVNVNVNPGNYGSDGYAVPYFYNENGATRLLVGSLSGKIVEYTVPSFGSAFNLVGTSVNGLDEGEQSAPWYEDINGDGKRDLFLGNTSGGLSFFSSSSPNVGIHDSNAELMNGLLNLFPNPTGGSINIDLNNTNTHIIHLAVYDLFGKKMRHTDFSDDHQTIDVSDLQEGVYIAHITVNFKGREYSIAKKIVKN